MPVLIVLYLLFLGILALLAQMVLPVILSVSLPALNVFGVGSALVPLVVIFASLELGDIRAPVIAVILGFLLDILTPSSRLGPSMVVLTSLSVLIATQAHKPEAHHWTFELIFALVGTFVYLLMDYIFILAQTSRWYWPLDAWTKIIFPSLLNLIISPLFFFLAGLPPRLAGWRPAYELPERRYAR